MKEKMYNKIIKFLKEEEEADPLRWGLGSMCHSGGAGRRQCGGLPLL